MSVLLADPATTVSVSAQSRSIRNVSGDLFLLAMVLMVAVFTTTGWFSADEVVMRQQSTTLAVDGTWVVQGNPAADAIDPDRQFALLARSERAGTQIVPYGKHPALPALISGFQRIGGEAARYVPAALGAIVAALIVSAATGWSRVGFWLVGIGSPLLFHVTVLWGHAHALAFSALALLGVDRICRRGGSDAGGVTALLAGLAGAALFRSEGLLLAAAIAVAFFLVAAGSKTHRYLAALAPLPLVVAIGIYLGEPVLREWLIGSSASPLGPSSGEGLTLASRFSVAQIMLIQPSLSGSALGGLRLVGLVILIAASCAAWSHAISTSRLRALALIGGLCYVLAFAEGPSPALLITMPLLALALPWARFESAYHRVLGVVALSFVGAVILTSYDNAGGGDWGARYLYIVVPFLAALATPAILRAWDDPGGRSVVLAGVVAAAALQGAVVVDLIGRGETVSTVDAVAEAIGRQESKLSNPVVAVSDERLARFLYDRGLRGASFHVPVEREEEFEELLATAGVANIIWVDLGTAGVARGVEPIETHGSVSIRTAVRR